MKIIKFEGTAEEFTVASRLFEDNIDMNKVGTIEPTPKLDEEAVKLAARKIAYKKMLTRRPILEGQMDLYKALSGGELEYEEYLRRMNRSESRVAGVHGALGKRINGTAGIVEAGLPGNMNAIAIWRNAGGKRYLGLKPEFVEVLNEENVI